MQRLIIGRSRRVGKESSHTVNVYAYGQSITNIVMTLLLIILKLATSTAGSIFDDHQLHPKDGFKLSITSSQDIVAATIPSSLSNDQSTSCHSNSRQLEMNNGNSFQSSPNDFSQSSIVQNNKMKGVERTPRTISSITSNSSDKNIKEDVHQSKGPRKVLWKDVTKSIVAPTTVRNSQTSILRRLQRGRITCDFGSYTHQQPKQAPKREQQYLKDDYNSNTNDTTATTNKNGMNSYNCNRINSTKSKYDFSFLSTSALTKLSSPKSSSIISSKNSKPLTKNAKIRITVDPSAIGRLSVILLCATSSFGSAFMGTLRLLAPLVVSRRILVFIGTLISDWYAGRYFRKTFTRLEKLYIHYYETPATFRALSRSGSQFVVYLTLARIMGWLVGITHPPCRSEGRGLAFFCGLLWLGSVVGTGHAFSTAVALWGGPLRLQAANHPTKTSVRTILRRPWHILQWLQNPEQWISLLSIPERRPFDPNPIAFPVTWPFLRLVQMIGIAKAAASEPADYLWCPSDQKQVPKLMKLYLIQLALCDEWCRVFIKERRLGLGIFVAFSYAIAMGALMVTCIGMNGTASLLLLPSLLALIVSTWLNLVIYCNRYIRKRKNAVFTPISSL